jgi:endonuclease YncB( thermonuclease family)
MIPPQFLPKAMYGFFGLLLLFLAACAESSPPQPSTSPPPAPVEELRPQRPADLGTARVREVLGPATLALEDGRQIRLLGLEAIAPGHVHYVAALAFTQSLVLNQEVGLELGAALMDESGQAWFYVWVEGLLLNYEVLRAGYGRFLGLGQPSQYDGFLQEAQGYAQTEALGLWQTAAPGLAIESLQTDNTSPATQTLGDEVLYLLNRGEAALAIGGYQVSDAQGNTYRFPEGASLPPAIRLGLYVGCGQEEPSRYYWCAEGPIWDAQDLIRLSDPQGQVIDQREIGRP